MFPPLLSSPHTDIPISTHPSPSLLKRGLTQPPRIQNNPRCPSKQQQQQQQQQEEEAEEAENPKSGCIYTKGK
ncbi:hypothetical protein COCC4DRAFT_29563 [Bipolaris maydis ATCC 48331]|uniref:Uncharacterized protein n=2 Tax=Cochliobolus heterostrophus TaxID=5016 RepID=M2UC75_COCH5|nr:uncharacterized protein COCC4DRAFT_29563 [Bipolaris maydis ATCC 48331]EMD96169.1 hypothetical protein COCHEDRAFT_1019576 [Bipolaris maydis C5]ENI11028.1 hypothetical protein COCC4DRAFT_29563 [Bipolaris maydis ATCC 48331]